MSVHAFLQKMKEVCEARGVTKTNFRNWFILGRNPDLVQSYKRFYSELEFIRGETQTEFKPFNYDEELLEEFRRRTQGKD